MTTIETSARTIQLPEEELIVDEAQLAAVAFLARYSGRTLDAYRHDLRGFFRWAADSRFSVLAARRPHIELYRTWVEERGLAAATIDWRLSTVCGFYRFAHIDGRHRRPPQPARHHRRLPSLTRHEPEAADPVPAVPDVVGGVRSGSSGWAARWQPAGSGPG